MSSYPITHYRGETFLGATINFSLSGTPVDLTGASIKLQIKADESDATAKYEASTDDGKIVISDPANGQFICMANEIIDIVPREYRYDIKVTLASGRVMYPIQNDTFTVTANVTRE